MARRLVAMGHDVQLVTTDREVGVSQRRQRSWFSTNADGICVHWLPVPYSNHMTYGDRIRAFMRFAWSACTKAAVLGGDLVYATSTPLTIAVPGVYVSRKNRIPMIFEVRDLWPAVPIAIGALKSPVTIAAARRLERFAYRNAAHIVALSPTIRDGVVARGYDEHNVTIIPNACDPEVFDIGPLPGQTIRRRHTWLQVRPLVLYAGALGRVNGVAYLARVAAAASRLDPEICFVAIGDGKEEDLVRATAAEAGVLDRNFFMLPSVPRSEIAMWLSAADIATSLVMDLPELHANSANKFFDTLAAGKPVAINHAGWLADLLRDTGAGLVLDPRDTEAAAAQLVAAVRDTRRLEVAGLAARELAYGRFNRDQLADRLDAVIRDTAARWAVRSRPPPIRGTSRP
jgi:glycosyltransferase involved in cell wall biosynthesis